MKRRAFIKTVAAAGVIGLDLGSGGAMTMARLVQPRTPAPDFPKRPLGKTGVEVTMRRDGAEVRIEAGSVVLSAGAYGTPAIRQRSGGGDATLLFGVPPLAGAG